MMDAWTETRLLVLRDDPKGNSMGLDSRKEMVQCLVHGLGNDLVILSVLMLLLHLFSMLYPLLVSLSVSLLLHFLKLESYLERRMALETRM